MERLISSRVGIKPADLGADQVPPLRVGEVGDDLRDAEHAHRERHEADAVEQIADAEGEAGVAGVDVGADEPQQHAEQNHAERLEHRAARQHDGKDEAQRHQREIVGRRELLGELGQRRRRDRNDDGRHAAGEEGADGGDGQRGSGPALARHLVAVEGRDHRADSPGRLTRMAVVEPPYCAP